MSVTCAGRRRPRDRTGAGRSNDADLPQGEVLVVGSGQAGAQIAEDLHLAGRKVPLCVGTVPRMSRFYRGRDVVDWLDDMGHYRLTIDDFVVEALPRTRSGTIQRKLIDTGAQRTLPRDSSLPC